MKIEKKRITASIMSLVMAGSLVFDSGILARADSVGVTFSKMNGSNIEVAETVQFGLKQDGNTFSMLNKSGTAWDGVLWIFDGKGKESGNAAYCMALGKAASSSNQYAVVDAAENAEYVSKVLKEKKAQLGPTLNAISRYMYPTYTDSNNIEFYMTRINETYAAGGKNVNGYEVIGGVPLSASWDDCRWWQTFAVITSVCTAFGDQNNVSNAKKKSTLSSDEYRGISQAVVWELMGDLPSHGIKANISGEEWVHATSVDANGYISGAIHSSTGTNGAYSASAPITNLKENYDLYTIPSHLTKGEVAQLIGCTEGELSNYINVDLVDWTGQKAGALYRLQKALMIKATILKGTHIEGGNSLRYICSPEEVLTRTGKWSSFTKDAQDVGQNAADSSYYMFNFTQVDQTQLTTLGGQQLGASGDPVMVTPWCYVSLKGGQGGIPYRDGNNNVIIYDVSQDPPVEIGAMDGLKIFSVPDAGTPITGEEANKTIELGFVYAIEKSKLDAALADDRFAEEVDGKRQFKSTIGANWYIFDYASQKQIQPEKYVAAVGIPAQNRAGNVVSLQENAVTQNLLKVDVKPTPMTNGFIYDSPLVKIKKIGLDNEGNEVKLTGGSFDVLDEAGNVVMGNLSVNGNGYISMGDGDSLALLDGKYTLVENQVPQAVDDPTMEFKEIDPVAFSVPLGQQELLVENTEKPPTWWLFGRKMDAKTGEILEGATIRLSKLSGDEKLGYLDAVVKKQVPKDASEGVIPYTQEGEYVIWEIPPEPEMGTGGMFGGPGTYVIHEIAPPSPLDSEVLGKTVEYEIPSNLQYPDGPGIIIEIGKDAKIGESWWNKNFDLTIKNDWVEDKYGSLKLEKRINDPQYNDQFTATFGIYDLDGNPYDLTEASQHGDWIGTLKGTNQIVVEELSTGLWGFHIPMIPLNTTLIVKEEEVQPSPPFTLDSSLSQYGTSVRIREAGQEVDGEWTFNNPNVLKLTNRADGLVNMQLQKAVRDETDTPVTAPNPLLAGFEFTALGEDGVSYLARSNVNGEVKWSNIPKQKYTVTETGSKGYQVTTPYDQGVEADLTNLADGDTYRGFVQALNRKYKVDLEVLKQDGQGQPLAGAKFMLLNTDTNEYVALGGQTTVTTNQQGKITFEDLPEGEYRLTEVEAPSGYTQGADSQVNFTVSYEEMKQNAIYYQKIQKTINNEKQDGSLKILKYDVNGTVLAGAQFKIERLDGLGGQPVETVATDVVTGQDGTFLVGQLKHGVYRVTETKAPEGYVLDAQPQEVEILLNDTYTVTFQNKPETGELRIQKTVSSNPFGLSLSGAKFRITGEGLDVIVTTDPDGKASYSGLRYGKYQVQEVEAPSGFHMDAQQTAQEVQISKDLKVVEWSSPQNHPDYGYVTIEKKPKPETLTNLDLSGFKFKLYADEQCTTLADPNEFTTDAGGFTRMSVKLKPGNYWFREESAPEDWVLDQTPIKVEVPKGVSSDTPIKVVQHNQLKGSVEIVKKVYNSNGVVAGAEFEIRDAGGATVETLVTNASGKASSGKLDPGTYTLIETKVPEGFTWAPEVRQGFSDGKNGVQFQVGTQAKVLTFYFENDKEKGSILVYKEDKETGQRLQGATFWLYDKNKQFLGRTATSGADGLARFDQLELGTYYVKEQTAPSGYELNLVEFEATLTPTAKEVPITVQNEKKEELFQLKVMKYDKDSGAQLAGGKFQLYSLDGQPIGDPKVTPENGIVQWTDLPAGKYLVKEIEPPQGYVDTGLSQIVDTANAQNGILAYKFPNKKPSDSTITVNLVKYGENISVPLAGVRFRLTNLDTNEMWEYTTDQNGQISVGKLKPGNYKWTEVQAAQGYLLTKNGKLNEETFLVEAGGSHNSYFFNDKEEKEVNVQLFKYEKGTSTPVVGAGFKLWEKQSGMYTVHYTDSSGRIFVTGLKPGTYEWEEIYAPQGFVLDATKYEVNALVSGETYTTTVYNEKVQDASLRLIKYEKDSYTVIPGVTFELRNTKTGESKEYQTDEYGQIVVSGLKHGTYAWIEKSAPTGYQVVSQSQYVQITENKEYTNTFYNEKVVQVEILLQKTDESGNALGGAEFVLLKDGKQVGSSQVSDAYGRIVWSNLEPGKYTVREVKAPSGYLIVGDGEQTVDASAVKASQQFTVKFTNKKEEEPRGSVEVRKVDEDGRPLEGVEFDLRKNGTSVGTKMSDRNGYVRWQGLSAGEYQLVEVKTLDGYVLDEEPYRLVVSGGGTATVTVTNYREEGEILLVKRDRETDERLEGARFALYDADYGLVKELVTDADGEARAKVSAGTYVLEEMQAPSGYVASGESYRVDVKRGALAEITVYNDRAQAQLVINKVDVVDGSPLPNAEFCIWDSSMTRQLVRGNSGPDGLATFQLEPGSYYYQELVAPPGYVIDGQPYPFTLYENGEVLTCKAPNVKAEGSVEILKLDSGTGLPLAGAIFEIYDAEGQLVTQVMTGEDGVVRVGLNVGSYSYREVQAPSGYYPDGRTVQFEITAHGHVQEFVHYNDKIVLPKTGDFGESLGGRLPLATIVSTAALVVYVLWNRKELFAGK